MMSEPVVLLVEDDENDAYLFRRHLRKACPASTVREVKSGQAAMDYLGAAAPYTDRAQYPFPAVVVLDFGLLLVSGFEVLAWIRQHPEFNELPILILSGSSCPGDKQRALELGASQFFEKAPKNPKLCACLQALLRPCLSR